MDLVEVRRRAAQAAAELLPETGVIGLGTGSTTALFIDAVAAAIKGGKRLQGVATSLQSRRQAEALGIPLLDDAGPWDIALCVDGADEVSHDLDLIKGGGGAHLREKVVNAAARMNVIIVDEKKLSHHLGEKWAVPVEVARFGHAATARQLARFGQATLRCKDGQPLLTDNGNFIYDLKAGIIEHPGELEAAVTSVPGVVETGLFVRRTQLVLVGTENGVRRLEARR